MTDLLTDFLSLFQLRPHPNPPTVTTRVVPPAAPVPVTPSSPLPTDALTFVEVEEDGSPAYYAAHYTHWDWPEGASGPTLGVGYDCGYVTRAEAMADWSGIVPPTMVIKILGAVGLRGEAAAAFVQAHRDEVTITWDQGVAEFTQREVPKWLTRCRAAIPNFDKLPGECQGALFSLSYNRGTGGYDDPGPRGREMYEIKQLMASPHFAATQAYLAPVPALFVSMQRLWPPAGSDLWRRRAHEAALFQKGMATLP